MNALADRRVDEGIVRRDLPIQDQHGEAVHERPGPDGADSNLAAILRGFRRGIRLAWGPSSMNEGFLDRLSVD